MNNTNSHPLQSKEWGEFRRKTGIKVIERDSFLLTIHPIPHIPLTIGYFPKGPMPTKEMITELKQIGKENNCIFIQLEPNIINSSEFKVNSFELKPSARPLFTKYTFILDLTKSEDELLKNMHSKTRYNIKVAQKHTVEVVEDNSDEAFEEYLRLTRETTQRQGFYAHTEKYHRLMWETLKEKTEKNNDALSAHLFLAKYNSKPLVAWIVFVYKDILYYPYGASSSENRETMASNLMMWEVIKWGKNKGLKSFDMWGALGPEPDPKDPWSGFHRFKQGYGPEHVEFVGSYDLVINPILYEFYKIANTLRWALLKFKK